jgi:hypothetical protein
MPDVNAAEGGGLLVGGMLCWMVFGLIGVVFWLWALVDAIRNPALDSTMRLIWVLVIIFLSLLGALLYLVIGRGGPGGSAVGPGGT